MEQTLQKGQYATKDQWNILVISFGLDGVDLSSTKEEYEVSLISREDGKYLYRGKIAPCNLTKNDSFDLCDGQKEGYGRGISASNETYRLRISYAANSQQIPGS